MKTSFLRLILVGLLALPAVSSATLIDRGGGLLYDDILDITWLQDANYAKTSGYDDDGLMNWASAKAWATHLKYGGVGSWRLPRVKPSGQDWNYNFSDDGSTDVGYNINSPRSELAFMYFNNLGLKSWHSPSGAIQATGLTGYSNDIGLAQHIMSYAYWTGTDAELFGAGGWLAFDFYVADGMQDYTSKLVELHAWAVHDGDVANSSQVPEPGSTALLIAAMAGLLGCRRQQRRT